MKVLVVSVNRSRQPAAVLPYGACVAAQAALGAGHETRLPGLVAATAGSLVEELLAANGLRCGDISRWAVHPGGENVINSVREKLELADEDMRYTRKVLSELGNMSSATVWFILEEMERDGLRPGELALMLAFGAGLSAHACLLKKV